MTDEELVDAARRGDGAALDALLRRHADRLGALCRRLAGNPHDGADCLQEALVAIVRGLPAFDGRSRFGTWAHRVTTNACLDELRRRGRRPVAVGDPPETGGASGEGGVDARLAVDSALATLPEEFRVAVVLRDLCDLDYAEIAEAVGVPVGTVKSRIARGRAALADALAGNHPDAPRRPTPRP